MNPKLMITLGACGLLTAAWWTWRPPADETAAEQSAAAPVRPGAGPAIERQTAAASRRSVLADAAVGDRAPEPSVDPGCTPEPRYLDRGDGTTLMVYECVAPERPPRHSYEAYRTETLRSLAWGDAAAAKTLAMRLRERDEATAMSLIFRASALSGGDPAPVVEYGNAFPQPTEIDGVPVRRAVHARFVLSAVAELLGADNAGLPHWETLIRQASTDPEREIALLQRRAGEIVEDMKAIELEVTGHSTIGNTSANRGGQADG